MFRSIAVDPIMNVSAPFGVASVSVFDALSKLVIVPLAIYGA